MLGAIQVLHNAVGVGGCLVQAIDQCYKGVGPTLLALNTRGGGGVNFPEKVLRNT